MGETTVKAVSVVLRLVISSAADPLLVMMVSRCESVPVTTLPNAKASVLRSISGVGIAVPSPVRATVNWDSSASSLSITRLPFADPVVAGLNCTVTLWLAPTAIVTGSVVGETRVKAVSPVVLRWVTARSADPLLVMMASSCESVPVTTLPNAKASGLRFISGVGIAASSPVRATVNRDSSVSLLLITRLPLTSPVVAGLNSTVTLWLAPAAIVTGRVVGETRVKAVSPLVLRPVTARSADPLLVMMASSCESVPVTTLPNAKASELRLISGVGIAAPSPVRATVNRDSSVSLLSITRLPFADPVVAGLNSTVTLWLAPEAIVTGRVVGETRVKAVSPLVLRLVTARSADPLLVMMVSSCESAPSTTSPNGSVRELTVILGSDLDEVLSISIAEIIGFPVPWRKATLRVPSVTVTVNSLITAVRNPTSLEIS